MSEKQVECMVEGAIATVTLKNPPLNVFTINMTVELEAILDRLESDPSIRAVIVTGGEKVFCAGSDISEFEDFMAPGQVVERKLGRQNEVFNRLDRFPKPTIAAINGLAFGGGVEISMCCDLVVAGEGSKLALPEMKLGVFPSSGGPYRTTRRIGAGRTKQMIFLAEPVDALTALSWGLIDRMAPGGKALEVARDLATTLSERPPLAFSLCKELINNSFNLTIGDLIQQSLKASDRAFSSPECREGVRAFFAKEKPSFAEAAPQAGLEKTLELGR